MSRSWTFGLTLLALSVIAPPVFAQASSPPTAHVAYVDGRVVVEHDTTAEDAAGDTPLSPGDRVRSEDGRAELLTDEGSVIDLDEETTLDLQSTGLYRLLAGRLVVVNSGSTALQVDTPAGAVFLNEPGEYRIGLIDDQGRATLDLAVVRGRAEIASDIERLTVETGQRAWARVGEAPSYPVAFNSAQSDAFYDWTYRSRGIPPRHDLRPVRPGEPDTVLRHIRHVRLVELPTDIRLRLVSARCRRVAAVLQRSVAALRRLGLDVDRR